MLRHYILFILLVFFGGKLHAQSKLGDAWHFLITPSQQTGEDFGYTYSYGEMRSKTSTGNINYKSFRVGVRFSEKRHKATVGYTWFPYDESLLLYSFDRPLKNFFDPGYYTKADVFAYTLNYEHYWLKTKRFIISTPVSVGIGTNFRDREDNSLTDDLLFRNNADVFYPVQGGVYGEWKASRYIGLSARYGYRFMNNDTFYKKEVSNTYYNIGITLHPILLLIDIFSHKKKKEVNSTKQ